MSNDNVIDLSSRRKEITSSTPISESDFDEVVLVRLYFKKDDFIGVDLAIENCPTGRKLEISDYEKISWASFKAYLFIVEKLLAEQGKTYSDGSEIKAVWAGAVFGNGYEQIYVSSEVTPSSEHMKFIETTEAGVRKAVWELIWDNVKVSREIEADREPNSDQDFEDYPGMEEYRTGFPKEPDPDRSVFLTAKPFGSNP